MLISSEIEIYFHLLPTVVLRGIAQYDDMVWYDGGGVDGVLLASGVPRAEWHVSKKVALTFKKKADAITIY